MTHSGIENAKSIRPRSCAIPLNACTIIAQNYMGFARVLADSFYAHHPDGHFTVLVIDADPGSRPPEGVQFDLLSPYEIGLSETEFHQMAMIYDIVELATALKPFLLRTLLVDAEHAVYLDPDIRIYRPLGQLETYLGEHPIVVTPHSFEPIPRDGREAGDKAILIGGAFNLGFIGVSESARDFLDWWGEQLRIDCLNAPNKSLFVDQRWVDLASSYYDVFIIRDRTLNVAYWNLHERTFEATDGGYLVDGEPLGFFHFSGFDPSKPHLLSKNQGDRPRILLSENPSLREICAEYAELLEAAGHRRASGATYRYGRAENGMEIDPPMRRLYRDALIDFEAGKRDDFGKLAEAPPDPLAPGGGEALVEWLRSPTEPGLEPGIGRYLEDLWHRRPHVNLTFPSMSGRHGRRYVDWILSHGQYQEAIPPELLPEEPKLEEDVIELGGDARNGLNIVGYLNAELGVGQAARHVIAGVEEAGIPFATLAYDETVNRQGANFPARDENFGEYDINVVCVNADRFRRLIDAGGWEALGGRYTVGLWWWEVEDFPEVSWPAFDLVDEVWAGSEFVADAIRKVSPKPVFHMPMPVAEHDAVALSRADVGLGDEFTFVFTFDFLSVFERKNPIGLIEAYTRAFAPEDGAALVIKSINGEMKMNDRERLVLAASERPDIRVIDEYLDAEANSALIAHCDAYVSLHRSEGFGLTMAEAMSYARPVIATAYSGNLDFMSEDSAYLVPFKYALIGSGNEPYPPGTRWAEPDLEAASRAMRSVFEDREEATRRGERGAERIRRTHSRARSAEFIRSRVGEIRRSLKTNSKLALRALPDARAGIETPGPLGRAMAYIERGPDAEADSRLGSAGKAARSALYRALRPYANHQREVDRALADAIEDLETKVREFMPELVEGAISSLQVSLLEEQRVEIDRLRSDIEAALRRIEDMQRTDEGGSS